MTSTKFNCSYYHELNFFLDFIYSQVSLSLVCLYILKLYENSFFNNFHQRSFDSFKENYFIFSKNRQFQFCIIFSGAQEKNEKLFNSFPKTRKALKSKYNNQQK